MVQGFWLFVRCKGLIGATTLPLAVGSTDCVVISGIGIEVSNVCGKFSGRTCRLFTCGLAIITFFTVFKPDLAISSARRIQIPFQDRRSVGNV